MNVRIENLSQTKPFLSVSPDIHVQAVKRNADAIIDGANFGT